MNNPAHKAISIRCAVRARDITSTTMRRSIERPLPVRPDFSSRRRKFIVPLTARAWIQIVPRVAPAPTSKGSKIATRSGCVIVYDQHRNLSPRVTSHRTGGYEIAPAQRHCSGGSRHKRQRPVDIPLELLARHDGVEHAMLQQELRSL